VGVEKEYVGEKAVLEISAIQNTSTEKNETICQIRLLISRPREVGIFDEIGCHKEVVLCRCLAPYNLVNEGMQTNRTYLSHDQTALRIPAIDDINTSTEVLSFCD